MSSTFAWTTSAPSFPNDLAFSDLGSRVSARAENPPDLSAKMARTSPPPCAPVAPTTAITFVSAIPSPKLKLTVDREFHRPANHRQCRLVPSPPRNRELQAVQELALRRVDAVAGD